MKKRSNPITYLYVSRSEGDDLVDDEGTRSKVSGLDLETFSRSDSGRLK